MCDRGKLELFPRLIFFTRRLECTLVRRGWFLGGHFEKWQTQFIVTMEQHTASLNDRELRAQVARNKVDEAREKFMEKNRAGLEKYHLLSVDKPDPFANCKNPKDYLIYVAYYSDITSSLKQKIRNFIDFMDTDGEEWYVTEIHHNTFKLAQQLGLVDKPAADFFFIESVWEAIHPKEMEQCDTSISELTNMLQRRKMAKWESNLESAIKRRDELVKREQEARLLVADPTFPSNWKYMDHPISFDRVKKLCKQLHNL